MKELALCIFLALAWAAAATTSDVLIPIETVELDRNLRSSYCRRQMSVVDTVVFHHTETPTTTTTAQVNEMHLNRGTANDPWLMIGYHYTLHAPYSGKRGASRVTYGRPLGIVGAHTGSDAYRPVSPETTKLLQIPENVQCGLEGGATVPPTDIFNSKGEVKGNMNTIGVAVIGNYAPYNRVDNPGGYPRGSPRYPTTNLIDMSARLACQLQKEYPRVTKIYWHSYYKPTSCPGLIQERIAQIKAAARGYGCVFE